MDERDRERLEREGWSLLLWSYRRELWVNEATPSRDDDLEQP